VGGVDIEVMTGQAYGQGVYTATRAADAAKYSNTRTVVLSIGLLGIHRSANRGLGHGVNQPDSWTPPSQESWIIFKSAMQLLPVYVIAYDEFR